MKIKLAIIFAFWLAPFSMLSGCSSPEDKALQEYQKKKEEWEMMKKEYDDSFVRVVKANSLFCADLKDMYKAHVMEQSNPQALQMRMPYSCDYVPGDLVISRQNETYYPGIYEIFAVGERFFVASYGIGTRSANFDYKKWGLDPSKGIPSLDSYAGPNPRAREDLIASIRMIRIPSGSFMMGSDSQGGSSMPKHVVEIEEFLLQEHEVTLAQWNACVKDNACYEANPGDASMPAWGGAVSYQFITNNFIPWLNKTTGKSYRLPTEAEWEYAARAGSQMKYTWGDEISCDQANFGQHYRGGKCGSETRPKPVKSFNPNEFGLYDVHGNVGEWTADCWNPNYNGAPQDGSAWLSGDCTKRVVRGGDYGSSVPWVLEVGARSGWEVDSGVAGFRLAHDI